MHRFCQELRGEAFLSAHPILQAAYAHYAFVVVHPFTDGNGRVARALASVYTVRAASLPLLILADQRPVYLDSLEAADAGNFQRFVGFIFGRAISSVELALESFATASLPDPLEQSTTIAALFKTPAGLTHAEVDECGTRFITELRRALLGQAKSAVMVEGQSKYADEFRGESTVLEPRHRKLVAGEQRPLAIKLETLAPAAAQVSASYALEVPIICADDSEFIIRAGDTTLTAGVSDLYPTLSPGLALRITMFAQGQIGSKMSELAKRARQALTGSGYSPGDAGHDNDSELTS